MSYGLFRAMHFHNPARYSEITGPLRHFFLISGRIIKSFTHCYASMPWVLTFDPGIIYCHYKTFCTFCQTDSIPVIPSTSWISCIRLSS